MQFGLSADRAFGVKGGALRRAYCYLGMLPLASFYLRRNRRPQLLAYTDRYYPLLMLWIGRNALDLRAARAPCRWMPANKRRCSRPPPAAAEWHH